MRSWSTAARPTRFLLHEPHPNRSAARLFVDVKNGEPVPRKSILKSRSRENSVCSDTSESSAADFEEGRRAVGRSFSHDETTQSDTSDGVTEEESPTAVPLHRASRFEVSLLAPPVFGSRCLFLSLR